MRTADAPDSRAAAAEEAAAVLDPASLARLFRCFERHEAVLLAVSGGPDSTALMLLAHRWRAARVDGPVLHAATVDHGLRPEARREAESVAALAGSLEIPHAILPWLGRKSAAGLQEAARDARYGLLAGHAGTIGAGAVASAHTCDDQAETVLFRLMRGSGIGGLAGMRAERPMGDIVLVRPLLDVPKATLIAVCRSAGVGFTEDPSNFDTRFARARLRSTLMPALAAAGFDAVGFARLAERMARAEKALEAATDAAAAELWPDQWSDEAVIRLPRQKFAALPAEIGLRLLGRAVDAAGAEGPVELGKLEALFRWICEAPAAGASARTLAGAMIRLEPEAIAIGPAPARRASICSR